MLLSSMSNSYFTETRNLLIKEKKIKAHKSTGFGYPTNLNNKFK